MPGSTTTSGTLADPAAGEPHAREHGAPAAAPRAAAGMRRLGWVFLAFLPVVAAPWVSRALFPRPRAFNSDLAIPVLMTRAREWSLYDAYYWGQDRLGTWHLLLMRAFGQLSGHTFDYAGLHVVGTAWVLLAAVVMARLAGAWGWAAGGLLAAVLVGNSDSRFALFDAAHPYAWQITALLLAWWGLRALAERPASGRWGPWRLAAATAFAVFLAQWMSPLSGQMLLLLAGVEALRAGALDAARERSLVRRLAEGGAVVAAGIFAERMLRAAFHLHARARYGNEFRTWATLDRGHLADNARHVAGRVMESASLPLLAVGTAGACAAAVVLFPRARGGRAPAWRVEGAALVLACWALAAVQLPVFFLLRHMRINSFSTRYFSLFFVFGALAGLLTLAWLVASLPGLARRRRAVLAMAGVAGVAVGVLRLPAPGPRPDGLARIAARLEARAPGTPLLGGYWSTYVFAALQHPETMLPPVPCEGRGDRTPWWSGQLGRHRWVVVAGNTFECPDTGPRDAPSPWVYQYGVLLRLVHPRWQPGADVSLSLYENANARTVAHTTRPAAAGWRYCDTGATLRLDFAPRGEAQVMLARVVPSPAATLLAAPVFADGSVGPPVSMRATGRLHRVELRAAGAPLVGARITVQRAERPKGRQRCQTAATVVVGD